MDHPTSLPFLREALLFLALVGIFIPLLQRFRINQVIGFLVVGIVAGPFGSGRLFPAGILREPVSQLARADAVLITRADASEDLAGLKDRIGRYTKAPVFASNFVPRSLVSLEDGVPRPLAELQGRAVIAAAGIARPDSFARMLAGLGASVRMLRPFPDHHRFLPDDLAQLRALARERGASVIITTEKDAVKLAGMPVEGIWVLRIGLEVKEKTAWERMVWGN